MRRARAILLFCILGALATLATAWTAALTTTQPNYKHYTRRTFLYWDRAWECSEFHDFARNELVWVDLNDQLPWPQDPSTTVTDHQARMLALARINPRLAGVAFDNTAPSWSIFSHPQPPPRGTQGSTVVFGWPAPCLEYSLTNHLAPNQTSDHALHDGLRIRGSPYQSYTLRALPLRPHFVALALDWAFFTLLLLALARGLPHLRRALRRRRNLCPHCAYTREGLAPRAPCPECGRCSILWPNPPQSHTLAA